MYLKPSEIFFSQDSINNVFDKRCAHSYEPIGNTLDALCEGRCSVSRIPRITVVERDGKWVTADNRRLWVFRELERLGKCDTILVDVGHYIPSAKLTSFNGGISVHVRGRPGGLWHNKPPARKPSASNISIKSNSTNTTRLSIPSNTNIVKENQRNKYISSSPPPSTRTYKPIVNSYVGESSTKYIVQNSGRSLRTSSSSSSSRESFTTRQSTAAVPHPGLAKPLHTSRIQPTSHVRPNDFSGLGYTTPASNQSSTETWDNNIRTKRAMNTTLASQDSHSSSMYQNREHNLSTRRTTSSYSSHKDVGCCIIL